MSEVSGLKGKHIFIVEDNTENRIVFQMVFIKYGATVAFERWGRDTVPRMLGTTKIDLVILDLMLSQGISGYDIFDAIRANPHFADVPIVAVSAMDPAVAVPKTRAKGFNGFIAKPVDTHLFPQQIADVLAGQAIWHTVRA